MKISDYLILLAASLVCLGLPVLGESEAVGCVIIFLAGGVCILAAVVEVWEDRKHKGGEK